MVFALFNTFEGKSVVSSAEEKSVYLISPRLSSCCGDVVGLVIEFLSISDIQGPTIVDLDEGGVLGGKLCLALTSLTRSRAR